MTIYDLLDDCLADKYPDDLWVRTTYDDWVKRREKEKDLLVGCSAKEYQFLHAITDIMKPWRVLEVGCGHGASTEIFCRAVTGFDSAIVCVDMESMETCHRLVTYWDSSPPRKCFMQKDSRAFFNEWISDLGMPFDLIFLDGDHREAEVTKDLEAAFSILKPKGILLAHDIVHPGSEYIEWILERAAAKVGRRTAMLKNTDGPGIGVAL
jgi:predicted O-methyltransferase YrrM